MEASAAAGAVTEVVGIRCWRGHVTACLSRSAVSVRTSSDFCRWESAITTGRVMSDILHELISEDELGVLIDETLDDAGVDIGELRSQAHRGRFSSEKVRRTWFVVNGLGRG